MRLKLKEMCGAADKETVLEWISEENKNIETWSGPKNKASQRGAAVKMFKLILNKRSGHT